MNVKINNKAENIPEEINIPELLKSRHMRTNSAVWVNGRQLLLREYSTYLIKENDEIKLLPIIGGG